MPASGRLRLTSFGQCGYHHVPKIDQRRLVAVAQLRVTGPAWRVLHHCDPCSSNSRIWSSTQRLAGIPPRITLLMPQLSSSKFAISPPSFSLWNFAFLLS